MKILIADDEDSWIKVSKRFFSEGGHEVVSADTYAKALELARLHLPDVMLIDGSLPDGDALAFCAAVRSDRRLERSAILVVSGDEVDAESCGAEAAVLKGGPLSDVEAAISAALAKIRG